MKEDIEVPIAKDVYVAIAHEWDKDFLAKEWNAYIINDRATRIDMVLIVSKGYDGDRKTSTLRHAIGVVEKKAFEKIEMLQEDVFVLNNEFFVTYYADNKLFERRFIFEKNSIGTAQLKPLPILEQPGILAK